MSAGADTPGDAAVPIPGSSADSAIEQSFGRTVAELLRLAATGPADPARDRVLEARTHLTIAERRIASDLAALHRLTQPGRVPIEAGTLLFYAQRIDDELALRQRHLDVIYPIIHARPSALGGPGAHATVPTSNGPTTSNASSGPGR
ncbi:hypothetical protein [Streptomyces sp. NPDC127098]|uniref:hypothetical protein n=1 Tax=Streptomyces sp. NPDC127098 TaxID=3347137 RepID=UPI00365BDA04